MVTGRTIGPTFTAFARDAHLFVGPFKIERVEPPQEQIVQQPAPQPAAVVEVPPKPAPVKAVDPLVAKFEARQAMTVTAIEPDDFTELDGVGEAYAKKLINAGFAYFQDIADAPVDEIAMVLSSSKGKAATIAASAKSKVG